MQYQTVNKRTCGECSGFLECFQESSEALETIMSEDKLKQCETIPACRDFKK